MKRRLELLCGEEGRSSVVSSRELLLCPSDTLGGLDMIDIPGGWGCRLILRHSVWMIGLRSFHLPHIKTCGWNDRIRTDPACHVTDDCPPSQVSLSIDPV